MPKYGIHSQILLEARETLKAHPHPNARGAGDLLDAHRDAAMLGAVGPDLFFFAPDYPSMQALIRLHQNFEWLIDAWDTVNGAVDTVKGVFSDINQTVGNAIGEEQLAIVHMLLNKLKDTTGMFFPFMSTGIMKGVVDGVDSIYSVTGVGAVQKFFDTFFVPDFQHGKPMPQWKWFDLLHYRRTGTFARNLLANATTPRSRAYALGYLSHIAADVTGHAYVNQICGAPYRRNVQRHVTAENYMDVWAFPQYNGGKPLGPNLLPQLGWTKDTCTPDIAALLSTTLAQTYAGAVGAKPALTPQQITETFEIFQFTLRVMGGMGIEKPKEPFADVEQLLAKAWNDIVQPAPSPPSTPVAGCTWQDMLGFGSNTGACYQSLLDNVADWFQYLGELALWLHNRVKEVLDFLLTALIALPVSVLLGLLYLVQLAVYQAYRMMHGTLSAQGLVFPLADDLQNAIGKRLIFADQSCVPPLPAGQGFPTTTTRYPTITRLGDSHLVCPVRGSETPNRLWNFVAPQAPLDPKQFIEVLPFSEADVVAYAKAATPDAAFALERQGRSLGNARDLTAWMIATAVTVPAATPEPDVRLACFADWNLDSDRGYGYRTWDGSIATVPAPGSGGSVSAEAFVT